MMRRAAVTICLFLLSVSGFAQNQLPDFTDLAEKQGPAVVNISTTQVLKTQRFAHPAIPFDEDDPAFDLFRRFMPRQMPGTPHEFKSESLGSGFIISPDGYLLTNAHVVDGADEVLVKLTDKREFKAKVIGSDKRTDVALIKIEASGLPTVRLGDPNRLRVGEWVVAIGSPFGFENSMTAGIVSAKGRSLPQESSYVPFIQTDVAINPGNSGGPLFNMRGEVVGINSQIYSRSGGYMGVSFAIPIDVAMEINNQLRASGKVTRGRIGVVIQEVTKEFADSFGLAKAQGALVASVEKGSPADKAGIEAGDVILKFDGKTVNQSGELQRFVGATKPGARVPIQVWRKGSSKDLVVSVGELSDDKTLARTGKRNRDAEPATANKLGLVLAELPAEQKKQLGVEYGLVVEDVRNGASRADLRQGDVILALVSKGIQTDIKTVEQFNSLISKFDRTSTLTLLVRRGDAQTFIGIKGVGDK
jgi:serine protease Do